MVQAGIPGGAGKKDNERPRKRRRMDHPARDVSQCGERVEAPSSSDTDNPYELLFVKDTAVTTCYGCKGRVRNKPSAPPPPPPYDLLIRHLEVRVYNIIGQEKPSSELGSSRRWHTSILYSPVWISPCKMWGTADCFFTMTLSIVSIWHTSVSYWRNLGWFSLTNSYSLVKVEGLWWKPRPKISVNTQTRQRGIC